VPRTEVRTREIKDQEVRRADLNTSASGDAVITKVIAGNNIAITETGADSGTGDVTINVPPITNEVFYRQVYAFHETFAANEYLDIGGAENAGYTMPQDGVIKSFNHWQNAANSRTYEIRVNNVNQQTINLTAAQSNIPVDIPVNQGDSLRVFIGATGDGADDVVTVEVEFPFDIETLKGDPGAPGQDGIAGFEFLTGNGAPGSGVGNDGDVYLDNTSGDFYRKVSGTWNFESNFVGPAGTQPYIYMTNNVMTNLNNTGLPGTQANNLNTTPILNSQPSLYTPAADGVIVNETGVYEAYVNLYQTGTSQRTNVAVQITVNGIGSGRLGAQAYIRAQTSHNEASSTITEPIAVTAGQKIGFRMVQLAGAGTVTAPASTTIFYIKKVS
jgi:hypothetical protein